jgi:hypothetical protein
MSSLSRLTVNASWTRFVIALSASKIAGATIAASSVGVNVDETGRSPQSQRRPGFF